MHNQLHKYGLTVIGFDFLKGRQCLEDLVVNKSRRYPLKEETALDIYTNQGTLHIATAPGFEFDGRSGPSILDWYAPNLGTLEERMAWFAHDCNGYGLDLSFADTNVLLYAMLRDLAKYRVTKATTIQLAVSLSKGWYGIPKPNDWCYKNIGKVTTLFMKA